MEELYDNKFDIVKQAYALSNKLRIGGVIACIFGIVYLLLNIGIKLPFDSLPAIVWLLGAFCIWYGFKIYPKAKQCFADYYFLAEYKKKYPKAKYYAFAKTDSVREQIKKDFASIGISEIIDCETTLTNVFISNDEDKLVYYSKSQYERGAHSAEDVGYFGNDSSTSEYSNLHLSLNSTLNKGCAVSIECNRGEAFISTEGVSSQSLTADTKDRLIRIYNNYGDFSLKIGYDHVWFNTNKINLFTACPDSLKELISMDENDGSSKQINKLYSMVEDIKYVAQNTNFIFEENRESSLGDGKYHFREN